MQPKHIVAVLAIGLSFAFASPIGIINFPNWSNDILCWYLVKRPRKAKPFLTIRNAVRTLKPFLTTPSVTTRLKPSPTTLKHDDACRTRQVLIRDHDWIPEKLKIHTNPFRSFYISNTALFACSWLSESRNFITGSPSGCSLRPSHNNPLVLISRPFQKEIVFVIAMSYHTINCSGQCAAFVVWLESKFCFWFLSSMGQMIWKLQGGA